MNTKPDIRIVQERTILVKAPYRSSDPKPVEVWRVQRRQPKTTV